MKSRLVEYVPVLTLLLCSGCELPPSPIKGMEIAAIRIAAPGHYRNDNGAIAIALGDTVTLSIIRVMAYFADSTLISGKGEDLDTSVFLETAGNTGRDSLTLSLELTGFFSRSPTTAFSGRPTESR